MAIPKINQEIEATKVRLISNDGKQLGIFDYEKAMSMATQESMDLVMMAEEASPPVCKILDYKKYVFDKKKQRVQAKRNHKRTILKEVKFRPDTDEGDYQVKLKRLIKFLATGDRAKVTIRFRGREVVYKERGYQMLERIQEDLGDSVDIEQQSKLEGKLLVTVFRPAASLNKTNNKANSTDNKSDNEKDNGKESKDKRSDTKSAAGEDEAATKDNRAGKSIDQNRGKSSEQNRSKNNKSDAKNSNKNNSNPNNKPKNKPAVKKQQEAPVAVQASGQTTDN